LAERPIAEALHTHMTPSQKKSNIKLGLVLASVALVFFCGVVFKMVMLGS